MILNHHQLPMWASFKHKKVWNSILKTHFHRIKKIIYWFWIQLKVERSLAKNQYRCNQRHCSNRPWWNGHCRRRRSLTGVFKKCDSFFDRWKNSLHVLNVIVGCLQWSDIQWIRMERLKTTEERFDYFWSFFIHRGIWLDWFLPWTLCNHHHDYTKNDQEQ